MARIADLRQVHRRPPRRRSGGQQQVDRVVGAPRTVHERGQEPGIHGRGERVAIFFPAQGTKRGWDAFGRVIRCDPGNFGYRVAVEFDPLPMAA